MEEVKYPYFFLNLYTCGQGLNQHITYLFKKIRCGAHWRLFLLAGETTEESELRKWDEERGSHLSTWLTIYIQKEMTTEMMTRVDDIDLVVGSSECTYRFDNS